MLLNTDSSRKFVVIGLLGAVAIHVSFLFISFEFKYIVPVSLDNSINVALIKPTVPSTEKPIDKVVESAESLVEDVEEIPKEIEDQETIDPTPTKGILIGAAILNNKEFKQLIIKQTRNHINNNPGSLEDFADSFKIPLSEELPDLEKVISPVGSGLYDTVRNGKVTCNLQVVMPFQNDFAPASINTSRDCTPRKKFDLNIK